MFISSEMLNELFGQSHAQWVEVWLQKRTNRKHDVEMGEMEIKAD